MATSIFQQALIVAKSETVMHPLKLELPKPIQQKCNTTPYLRRRMHSRLRGLWG